MLAALATAPLFALQHSPLVFGDKSVAGGAVVMLALVGLAVPFRMVMGWMFNRTGSLFLVGLAHACGNAVVTGTVVGDALVQDLFGRSLGPVHAFAFAAIGVVVAVVTRARLGLDEGAQIAGAGSGRAAGRFGMAIDWRVRLPGAAPRRATGPVATMPDSNRRRLREQKVPGLVAHHLNGRRAAGVDAPT